MRCRYCSQVLADGAAPGPPDESHLCARCAAVKRLQFVERQGDGVTGFREIMIAQIANEPNRKLLETRSWHFTVFLDERGTIGGFELTDADNTHLLKWLRGRRPHFYRLENLGKGYHNRDEIRLNGRFRPADVLTELGEAGHNIRPDICEVLREGIAAYDKG